MKNLFKILCPTIISFASLLSCSEEIFKPFELTNEYYAPKMELADCLTSCTNHAGSQEFYTDFTKKLYSEIDTKCHEHNIAGTIQYLPDRDYVKFQGKKGQAMKFIVKAIPTGKMTPSIAFVNSNGETLPIGIAADSGLPAQLSLFLPNDDPYYIMIEEKNNYNLTPIEYCADEFPKANGGQKYGYILEAIKKAPSQLKGLRLTYDRIATNDLNATQEIENPGDVYYLTFYAPAKVKITLKIQASKNSKPDFKPTVYALDTINNNLNWILTSAHRANQQVLSLNALDFRAAHNPANTTDPKLLEYAAVILDMNGKGGPGYSFDLFLSVKSAE